MPMAGSIPMTPHEVAHAPRSDPPAVPRLALVVAPVKLGDRILDDLLSRWYWLRKGGGTTAGHADRTLYIGDNYRPTRQYDDANGKLDADMDERDAQAVDEAMDDMVDPYRTAVQFDARNLYFGLSVWRSPRLPEDKVSRDLILFRARKQIKALLYIETA